MDQFKYYPLEKAHLAQGAVVVIDVLRAFTTAAYAFEFGAEKIFPVSRVQDAFNLRAQIPGSFTLGEVEGQKPKGFDFNNSPAELSQVDLRRKVLIQRTTAGTQGIIQAQKADLLLAASFVVARSTADYLRQICPDLVSFIITGQSLGRDGDEDLACAEYIEALCREEEPASNNFTSRVFTSSVVQAYRSGQNNYLSGEDIEMSLEVNCFDFYLPVLFENERKVIRQAVL